MIANSRSTFSWPQLVQRFPQTSTGKTHRPPFLHNGELFFDCGARLSAAEWVQRKRWNSQRLLNDDCGDAGGSWQFSRVNCQGKFGNARECEPVARALRPPPLSALRSGLGCWPPQRLQSNGSSNHGSAAVLVKVALIRERCRTGTIAPLPLAAGRQE